MLNALLLFVALNVGACGLLRLRQAITKSVNPAYDGIVGRGFDTLGRVYPQYSPTELDRLLRESWVMSLEYEPFTKFREPPVKGSYVNISRHGFRLNGREPNPWPPPEEGSNIFVFGGSTAFGKGLADWESVPA